jgi:hypothetical protein
MAKKQRNMKEELLNTVKELRSKEIQLNDTPALFRWSYPEEPEILFELLISKTGEQLELPFGESMH